MDDTNPIPKILLYGNSILIERLTSKLNTIAGWDVKRAKDGEVYDFGYVDFIVADLCDVVTSETLPILSALPGVMLIGVDAIANTLTVLTGRTRPLHSVQNVLDVLKNAM